MFFYAYVHDWCGIDQSSIEKQTDRFSMVSRPVYIFQKILHGEFEPLYKLALYRGLIAGLLLCYTTYTNNWL